MAPPRRTVCLVSFHPLLFPTVRGLLMEPEFEVTEYRAVADVPPRNWEQEIPAASVYIIEAQTRLSSTEAAIEKASFRFPSAPLLVIGERFDEANTFPLLRLRIKGLVTYAEAPVQLARAVEALASGGFWLPRTLLSRFVEKAASSGKRTVLSGVMADLTQREKQVLDGLLENLSNKEIAGKLGITERGVKFHVSNLLSKYQVRRRADLVLLFLATP